VENTPQPSHPFHLLNWRQLGRIFEATFSAWVDDNVPRLSASLTFYTLLSLAPFLIIVIATAAAVYGRDAAQGQLLWQIRDLVGREGAEEIQKLINAASKTSSSTFATIISIATMLFGASTVVIELQDSLNLIWKVPAPPPESRLCRMYAILKDRFYAFGLVVTAGLLLVGSLLLNAIIAMAGQILGARLPESEFLMHVQAFVVSLAVVTVLFAAIYKVMPAVELLWSDVLIGAAFTAVLFTLGKQLIAMYLGKVSIGSPYGAAGSLVAVLIWVYYSAQLFFMGAEFTRIYTTRHGSLKYRGRRMKEPTVQ
jgi:membrane protein